MRSLLPYYDVPSVPQVRDDVRATMAAAGMNPNDENAFVLTAAILRRHVREAWHECINTLRKTRPEFFR